MSSNRKPSAKTIHLLAFKQSIAKKYDTFRLFLDQINEQKWINIPKSKKTECSVYLNWLNKGSGMEETQKKNEARMGKEKHIKQRKSWMKILYKRNHLVSCFECGHSENDVRFRWWILLRWRRGKTERETERQTDRKSDRKSNSGVKGNG